MTMKEHKGKPQLISGCVDHHLGDALWSIPESSGSVVQEEIGGGPNSAGDLTGWLAGQTPPSSASSPLNNSSRNLPRPLWYGRPSVCLCVLGVVPGVAVHRPKRSVRVRAFGAALVAWTR